ncbi:MAG: SDR family NAD(P)-dependent oxidoreductase, partial [Alphaproteobacteria bacterium]
MKGEKTKKAGAGAGTGRKTKRAPAASPARLQGNDRNWGMSDDELATRETVFKDGLMAGQAVVITGGGTGLGKAMAFLFARLGADVTICGRREHVLHAAADSIRARIGRTVAYE